MRLKSGRVESMGKDLILLLPFGEHTSGKESES